MISQSQLESYLWGAATLLRGYIDAGDYKQFIFPLLFYKRLCDVYDEELADVYCPHCNISLIEPKQLCIQDNCKMVKFNISVQDSIKLSIIICVRRSCRWYTMSEEDNERLILRESHEW